MIEEIEHPRWILWCMRSWTSVLALAHHIVSEAAEKGVDIAATAIGIAAPLPNAISVYTISQVALGFNPWQSFAFSLALELLIFVVVEVALVLWTEYNEGDDSYKIPMYTLLLAGGMGIGLVMYIIYQVEVTHGGTPILATLPLLSLTAFVAVATKRWHVSQKRKRTESGASTLNRLDRENSELRTMVDSLTAEIAVRDSVQAPVHPPVHPPVQDTVYTVADSAVQGTVQYRNGDIVHGTEEMDTTDQIREIARRMGMTESGVNKAKIASLVGCSRTTVYNALKD